MSETRAIRIDAAVAIVAAALVPLFLVVRYGVNTPVGDEILIGEFLVRNHERIVPAFADLSAQHNESRKFFPRLIFFYLAKLTDWNLKYQMAVSVLLACATAIAIWRLARRTLTETAALTVAALSAILLFSPVQWWNWLSGIQIVAFTPLLMLTVSLLVLSSHWRPWWQLLAAGTACLIATFSYANGMVLWFLLIPSVGRKAGRILPWSAAGVASIALYFHGYTRPLGHPPLMLPTERPVAFVKYCLAFLGHPLAWERDVEAAAIAGGLIVTVFALCSVAALRSGERFRAALPWITIGGYALASALTTAAGRIRLGVAQALEPRYTTFSTPLIIAAIALAALALRGRASRAQATGGAGALVVLHLFAVHAAWPQMTFNYRERLMARALVQFALVLPDRSALPLHVFPDIERAIGTIDALDRIGYLTPPAIRTSHVAEMDGGQQGEFGAMNYAVPVAPGRWRLGGWAAIPGNRPADTVLVTAGGDRLAGIAARIALPRDDIGNIEPALRTSGWEYELRAAGPAETTCSVWAWDGAAQRAYRLANTFVLPPP